ncbi:TonB-dependent receptor domain-containing protein [Taibaiella lutea]|nr:TonB-dependent receptor [Taibaiella lutea]
MKPLSIVALLLFATFICNAQFRISGKVLDLNTGKPVDYATISISEQVTNKIIDGTTTDSSGLFTITGLPKGVFKIAASFLGYNTTQLDSVFLPDGNKTNITLPVIYLKSNSRELTEVTITGAAPVVENRIDKIVYNTANDVTAQGGVALDVLKKVPQVSVDADGNVELQGSSGIRFLINGKPSSIFGNSLADALSSIPASQIKSIEAITSPGAKYDAQGTGGIINIILKDNKAKGVNGNVNLSAGTRTENASVNLNMRSGNFGMNAFFSGNATLKSKSPGLQDRKSYNPSDGTTTRLIQDNYNDIKRNGYQSGFGFDWNVSKADIVTGSFEYSNFSNNRSGLTQQQETVTDNLSNTVSDVQSLRNSGSSMSSHSLDWSLDYKHKFRREGEEIDFNYNSSFGRPVLQYSQDQTMEGALNPFTGTSSYNTGTDNQTNISADYVRPIGKKATFEAGVKSNFQHINSLSNVSVLSPSNGEYVDDYLQSYGLDYKMNVYAGYVAASFSMFDFMDIKAGMRIEHTDVMLDYNNTHIPSYNTYFPSVLLSHNINDKQSVKFAYAHRIERPEYDELNPFLNLSDPYNITTGNPLLKPEIGDNMELGYSRSFDNGANFYLALSERINSNDIKPYTAFYPDFEVGDSVYQNVSITNKRNIGTEYNSGLILSGSTPVVKGLNLRGNLMLFHRHIVNTLDESITNSLSLRLNMNVSYEITDGFIAEAFGNYRSPFNSVQGKSPQMLTYTFAVRKQLWHKNASLGITATNIFSNYINQVTTVTTDTYDSYSLRQIPMRSVGLTFTYKFGKLEFNKDKHKDGYPDMPSDN